MSSCVAYRLGDTGRWDNYPVRPWPDPPCCPLGPSDIPPSAGLAVRDPTAWSDRSQAGLLPPAPSRESTGPSSWGTSHHRTPERRRLSPSVLRQVQLRPPRSSYGPTCYPP